MSRSPPNPLQAGRSIPRLADFIGRPPEEAVGGQQLGQILRIPRPNPGYDRWLTSGQRNFPPPSPKLCGMPSGKPRHLPVWASSGLQFVQV